MTISDKKYQVFINSTYTDLKEERTNVTDVRTRHETFYEHPFYKADKFD